MERNQKQPVVWTSVLLLAYLHLAALWGLQAVLFRARWATLVFQFFWLICTGLGITAGAHRLWCHRSYRAKLPLRLLLALFQTAAMQTSIYEWCRDHRMHHIFSETDADPHNASRGFFFSHVGWLMVRKHPLIKEKGKNLRLDDLQSDPVVRIQKRWYLPAAFLFGLALPTCIPVLGWAEDWICSFHVCVLRYVMMLNFTWLVNSAAHHFGYRPYDPKINPRENWMVSLLAVGEGFHNYHHTFPWDYKAGELGWYFNFSTFFIDVMAALGLAYDLKSVPAHRIRKQMEISRG